MLGRWFLLRKIQVFLSKWFINAYNPYITHLIPYIYIYIIGGYSMVSSIYDAWSPPGPHPQVRQQASSRSHSVLMLTIERRHASNEMFFKRCDDVTMLKLFGGASKTIFTDDELPIGSMYAIYANIGGILMVNVTIYSIQGSYGLWKPHIFPENWGDDHPESAVINRCFHELNSHRFFDQRWCDFMCAADST